MYPQVKWWRLIAVPLNNTHYICLAFVIGGLAKYYRSLQQIIILLIVQVSNTAASF